MDRREWYSDSDRKYTCIYHRDDCFQGGIGLLTFTGLKEPESVDSPEGPLCIAANGYQWLELVPEGGQFALTAMFHDGTLFEQYTDITLRNEVDENGDAAFYDLLLDVVVLSDGTPRVLDREELDEALSGGIISRDEYDLALQTADRVVDFYTTHKDLIRKKLFEYKALFEK